MKILGIENDSIASELNIKVGDELLELDGIKVIDILDYDYFDTLENFTMTIKSNSEKVIYEIEKYENETIGLVLEREIGIRSCRNNCIFCFVDQLPKDEDLRDTLKVKDDDYRHSFISGNYVTLTNITAFDIERIIRLKLSPLYISVHTTNHELREAMLGIKNSLEILPTMQKLYRGGIILHSQIVYCPGFNDDLENSINELSKICESLSIVPVGLTKAGNEKLNKVTSEDAVRIVTLCESLQKQYLKEKGTRFVWASDEFYIKAQLPIQSNECYENYSQIENGVGMIAKFDEDFDFAFNEKLNALKNGEKFEVGNLSIATGESAYELISEHSKKLCETFGGTINVYKIINNFFGSSVTVAGLIVGRDLFAQLKDKNLGDKLMLPMTMLKEFNDVFLDNMSITTLSKNLNVKIQMTEAGGDDFVNALVNEVKKK